MTRGSPPPCFVAQNIPGRIRLSTIPGFIEHSLWPGQWQAADKVLFAKQYLCDNVSLTTREPELMQKFFNKWVQTAFDLFGTDNSSSAHWAYVWGLKGRFSRANPKAPVTSKTASETALSSPTPA